MRREYVYRVVVDAWPTPDGKPWAGTYDIDSEIPEWLEKVVRDAVTPPVGEEAKQWLYAPSWVYERCDFDGSTLRSVFMPGRRRRYLSHVAACHKRNTMQAFGATVRIVRGEVAEWQEYA